MAPGFDEANFFRAVDAKRREAGVSWRELGRQLELSPSTFSRLSRGRRPDVETFVKVLDWLDLPADSFILSRSGVAGRPAGSSLPAIRAALRQDPRISEDDVRPLEDIIRVAYNRFSRRST